MDAKPKDIHQDPDVKWYIELWKGDFQRLFGLFGLNPVVVVLCAAVQEVISRMDILEKKYGYNIIYVNKDIKGLQKTLGSNRWVCDPITMINYLKMRSHRDNVVWFTIHSSINWQSLASVKSVIPDAKIISYVYDWQQLFVPKEHLHVWEDYVANGPKYALAECEVIEKVLEGKMVDGLIHGDYGDKWPMLDKADFPLGSLWMPRSCSRKIYQKQPPVNVENRLAIIGTVLHKSMFNKKVVLFQETNIEKMYHKICNDGYKIDIFTLFPKPECLEFYNKEFPHKMVRLHQGMQLSALLPTIAGRMKFGCMLYEWETDITKGHDEVSMPTKFFTYLALGIPILASDRLTATCRIIEQEGCGIVFKDGDINNFKKHVNSRRYEELLENVESCRYKYCTEAFEDGFASIMKRGVELPPSKAVFNRR
jgi:hypothetical protein